MPKKEELIYFLSLELENVRSFGSPAQKLDLSDGQGNPARWTLLLGDNGLGKTSLLQCLWWARFVPSTSDNPKSQNNSDDEITEGPMEPSLPEEENDVIERLIRVGCNQLGIKARFTQRIELDTPSNEDLLDQPIKTEIKVNFNDGGKLHDFLIDPEKNSRVSDLLESTYREPFFLIYGANRAKGKLHINQNEPESDSEPSYHIPSRLSEVTELYDAEEILTYLDYRALKSRANIEGAIEKTLQEKKLAAFKQIVVDILPDDEIKAKDIHIYEPPKGVCFNTFSGEDIPFSELSLGYQNTICFILDLAWRMSNQYSGPEIDDPFAEPAIIIIDEIDLHLHPLWQRKFIDKLINIFTGSQFIVTTHSPLIVQAAAAQFANLAVLQREGNHTVTDQNLENIRGWRVDQILTSDLFDLPGYGLDIKTEPLLEKRKELLSKPELTDEDKHTLAKLEAQIGSIPVMQNPKYDAAMDIILRAAEKLGGNKSKLS